jgi:translation initiation factor 4A
MSNNTNTENQQNTFNLDANKDSSNSTDRHDHDHAGGGPESAADVDASRISTNWTEVCGTFDQMGLSEDLLRGIYGYGYETPSAIQQRAILPILSGRDTIAQAQSGTGKTATFSISILQQLDVSLVACQAVLPPLPPLLSFFRPPF